jgi:putative nucleotidyltransferase with HDIG domain
MLPLVLGGWALLAVAGYLLVRGAALADARDERAVAELLEHDRPPAISVRPGRGRRHATRDEGGLSPRRATGAAGSLSPQRRGYAGVVLDRLAHHARGVLGSDRACLFVCAPDGSGEVTVVAASGVEPDLVGRRFPADHGVTGTAMRQGKPVVVPDLLLPGHPVDRAVSGDLRRAAAVPLAGPLGPRGALVAGTRSEGPPFGLLEVELLSELAKLASEALAHHERRGLAAGDSEPEIRALVDALARADDDTVRHSLEVAATARRVAERLELTRTDVIEVELAALLHDVGKLRLPSEILRKSGRLSSHERELVRLHPEWGSEMVARIPGLEAVALLVRLHHERPDGDGYPHALEGERIPVASRIVSVCDAYDAMTSDRPYRAALTPREAIEELERGAGRQFDPEVVAALASVVTPDAVLTR